MTERNAKCPCGSGKKYKACHLAADEASRRADAAAALAAKRPQPALRVEAPHEPPPPMDPEEARRMALWDRFEAAETEDKQALALLQLEGEPDMAADIAMMIVHPTVDHLLDTRRLDDLEAWLKTIERLQPRAFKDLVGNVCDWRAQAAVASGGDPRPYLLEWTGHGCKPLSSFFRALSMLQFHGRTDDLAAVVHAAWSVVSEDDDVMGHAVDQLETLEVKVTLAQHLVGHPERGLADTALHDKLAALGDLDEGWLERYMTLALRPSVPTWSPDDFTPVDREALRAHINALCMAFVWHLQSNAGWTWGRADLAADDLAGYLHRRAKSLLESEPKRSKRHSQGHLAEALLVPDPHAFPKYTDDLLDMFSFHVTEASALWAALPAWADFLASTKLVPSERAHAAVSKLAPLRDKLLKTLDQQGDPGLGESVRQAWAHASR